MRLFEFSIYRALRLPIFIIFLLFTLPGYLKAQAQEIQFINLTVKNGLSHNSITCFCQDIQGFIWIGTSEGLNRFDGNSFTIYRNIPGDSTSINDNSILAIYEDENGFLWIGTEKGGLNRFDPRTDVFTHYTNDKKNKHSISNNNITFISNDKNNNLWICTKEGLNLLPSAEKYSTNPKFKSFLHDPGNPNSITNNSVFSFLFDKKGSMWLSLYGGFGIDILDFIDNSFTTYTKRHLSQSTASQPGLSGEWILFVFEDSKGRFWISTWADGVTLYEPRKNEFTYYKSSPDNNSNISANNIENIIEDRHGNIWVATYGGGIDKFIEPANGHAGYFVKYSFNYNDLFSLSDNKVSRLFEDRSGNIWAGTAGHGLCKFDPHSQFRNIRLKDKDGLIRFSPSAITKTSDGTLWTGTKEGTLLRFINGTGKPDRFDLNKKKQPISDIPFITSLFEDEEGTLWITTHGSGILYILKKELRLPKPAIKNVTVAKQQSAKSFPNSFGFVRENFNKDLVFGGFNPYNTWILKRENKLKKQFHFDYYDYKRYLWSYENDGTSAWFGSFSHGVAKTDFNTSKRSIQFDYVPEDPYGRKSIPNGNVYSILKSKDNSVWFGTQKSLSCLLPNSDTLIHYTFKNGISNELVYGILEDENGYIWASTYNGLSKFDTKTKLFTNYYREDGIQGNEFNQFSYYKDKEGLLYFGGIYGITIVNPKMDLSELPSPEIKITGIYLANLLQANKSLLNSGIIKQSLAYASEIFLPFNQDSFSIEFSALEYSAPQKIKYMYKMEGYDKNWIVANQSSRIANYMNLPPRTYIFKIRSTNKEGIWSSHVTEMRITINPPFWNTLWFQVFAFLLIAGVIIGTYKWRMRNHKKRQKLLTDLVEEKTLQLRDSNAALESFSYSVSHDLRAPLRTINSFAKIIKEDFGSQIPNEANNYFDKISHASFRMGELIEGILKLARLASIELSKIDVNITHIAETLINNIAELYPDNKIISDITPGIIVKGDPVLLTTVMDNLLSNAFKFSSKNETIKIEVGKTGNFDKSKSNLTEAIFVKDYGVGFDMNYSDKLFRVFQRMHSDSEFEGTGIGLANVKKIINRHGGTIWAESEIGKETTFFFTIP